MKVDSGLEGNWKDLPNPAFKEEIVGRGLVMGVKVKKFFLPFSLPTSHSPSLLRLSNLGSMTDPLHFQTQAKDEDFKRVSNSSEKIKNEGEKTKREGASSSSEVAKTELQERTSVLDEAQSTRQQNTMENQVPDPQGGTGTRVDPKASKPIHHRQLPEPSYPSYTLPISRMRRREPGITYIDWEENDKENPFNWKRSEFRAQREGEREMLTIFLISCSFSQKENEISF